MLIQPCVACLLVSLRSKRISCVIHLLSLGVIQLTKTLHVVTQDWLNLEDEKYLIFIIGICWMQLRSISCSIDRIDSYKHTTLAGFFVDLLHSAAYCLYLPTLFLGPLILYSEFIDGVRRTHPLNSNFNNILRNMYDLENIYFTDQKSSGKMELQ